VSLQNLLNTLERQKLWSEREKKLKVTKNRGKVKWFMLLEMPVPCWLTNNWVKTGEQKALLF
jgi:hypothetical protein